MKKLIALFLPKEGKTIRTNRYMFFTCLFLVLLFFGMIGYLIRFMILDADRIIANPYNRRTETLTEHILRGEILSRDGKILARSELDEEGNEKRTYPFGRTFAHVVGYHTHGQSGLEAAYNYDLLTSHTDIRTQLMNGISGIKNPGDNIITTLDSRLQEAAYEALGDYRGAVVAMEPSTGKIRAMVSKPDYNPNDIQKIWSQIVDDANSSVLLNRATQGLYPPGSTYKVITGLEYLTEHLHSYRDFTYTCKGETVVNSVKIHCYKDKEHGKENLEEAFAHSCNTAFVTLGCKLDRNHLISLNQNLLFNQGISFDLPVTKSWFKITEQTPDSDLPQTLIGQGDTLMTPLHNALVMCTIANDG
ncbi:MAG: penicillin-binding protein 2, partial [Eubacterium sp.]|nr:penicillin-binding protein 2 [Eubacterium sp.]